MDQLLNNLKIAPLSLTALLVNLVLGAVLAAILGVHYRYLGSSLAGRAHFSRVFIFVALATTLIITIVKSSLALSLGLVGALSIVRFRTPVKEPEELAYLFMAIAIGLGMGADYRFETAAATLVILALVGIAQWRQRKDTGRNIYLIVALSDDDSTDEAVDRVHDILKRHCSAVDLRRLDSDAKRSEMTYVIDLQDASKIGSLTADVRGTFGTARLTLIDQQQMPVV